MSVTGTGDVNVLPLRNGGNPAYPKAFWYGVASITGDVSAGWALCYLRLRTSVMSGSLDWYSVQGLMGTRDDALADQARLEFTGGKAPGSSSMVFNHNLPVVQIAGLSADIAMKDILPHLLPIVQGFPRVDLALALRFAVNTNLAIYILRAWGFIWDDYDGPLIRL